MQLSSPSIWEIVSTALFNSKKWNIASNRHVVHKVFNRTLFVASLRRATFFKWYNFLNNQNANAKRNEILEIKKKFKFRFNIFTVVTNFDIDKTVHSKWSLNYSTHFKWVIWGYIKAVRTDIRCSFYLGSPFITNIYQNLLKLGLAFKLFFKSIAFDVIFHYFRSNWPIF